ncbi:hypothetical protein [Pseudolactococcus piscium]|nr:hypothetical protein [Lactococcus piscium]
MTVLTIDEIKDKVTLFAKKYDIPRVYLLVLMHGILLQIQVM